MKHIGSNPLVRSVSLSAALIAAPVFAETDESLPGVLILPAEPESVLPGDAEGAQHGVVVRRGSGFPEPVQIEEPETDEVVRPDQPTRRFIIRRRSRSGY
ncbi:MAG: hypothetical protein HKN98_08710 [Silicimonas sp.]|nr:hypothetical protein [Silicimonas sp.]